MGEALISRKTRNKYREALVGLTLHEINMVFQGAELEPLKDYEPPPDITGQRRRLVEQYYANIIWDKPESICLVVKAYQSIIEHYEEIRTAVINPEALTDTITPLVKCMEDDGFTFLGGTFYSPRMVTVSLVPAPALVKLTEAFILEYIDKGRIKIDSHDYAGAIASSYTLVEAFLKQILRQLQVPFIQDEGDIRKLYQLVAAPLTLNSKGEHLETYLKSILQGLKSQLMGLYDLANKSSDRHARQYNPARHHAKLAVNVAFTLCEFLLESFEYQQRKTRKVSEGKL